MSATWRTSQKRATDFGTHAGELEEFEHGGFVFEEQLFAEGEGSGLFDFLDIGGHAFANAGDVEESLRVFGGEFGELDGGGLDGFGGAAVGADAKGIASADFEQVGGLDEEIGYAAIVHGGIIGTRVRNRD